jgi:hypothetical protein
LGKRVAQAIFGMAPGACKFLDAGGSVAEYKAARGAAMIAVRHAALLRCLSDLHASRRETLRVKTPEGWQRSFDDPIPLPNGRALVTLKDVGD